MIHPIAGIVFRQLCAVFLAAVVLLATYVLAGRVLLPMAGDYRAEVEQRLSEMTGMQASITGLRGEMRGFNPVLSADRLSLTPADGDAEVASLAIDDLELILGTRASLLALRPIVARARLSQPVLEMHEDETGAWRLAGFSGAGNARLEDVFDIATGLGHLELTDASIQFRFANGEQRRFHHADLQFQSRQGRHLLVLDAAFAEQSEPGLVLTADFHGDHFRHLSGHLHADVADYDWAPFLARSAAAHLALRELTVSAQIWMRLDQGRITSADVNVQPSTLRAVASEGGTAGPAVTVSDLRANLALRQDGGHWQLWLSDLGMTRGSSRWTDSELYASMTSDGTFSATLARMDAGLVSGLLQDLVLLPPRGMDELRVLNPRGHLENLRLDGNIDGGQLQTLSVATNLDNVRVNARGAAPAVWGVFGYAELDFSSATALTRGFVEVDSSEVMLHLPNLFTDIWQYDRVNGRVNFRADTSDGLKLRVDSSVIVAQSDILSGRAQFATEYDVPPGESAQITLELLVGALEADVAQKSTYLPMAPNAPQGAQAVLGWVDSAVRSGEGGGSGFLFRGHVHAGAASQSRTVQMFYRIEDGVLQFDPEWPTLDSLDGYVVVDDQEVDVLVSDGQSMEIGFTATTAAVRGNPDGPGRWLTVSGQGRGQAGQGLQYLASTPVTAGLGAYFSNWQTEGDVDFALDLAIPFGVADAGPQINLRLGLDDNTIHIPEYALDIADVRGQLVFDARHGLSSEDLGGTLFGNPVMVNVVTGAEDQQGNDTRVEVLGRMDVDDFQRWPMNPAALETLLSTAEGEFVYSASLDLPQQGEGQQRHPQLSVRSSLEGVDFGFPVPLDKAVDQELPLDLRILFEDGRQDLRVRLGDVVSVNARITADGVDRGLVFLTPPADGVRVRRFDTRRPGLEVVGRVPRLDAQEWMSFLQGQAGSDAGDVSIPQGIVSQLDVTIDELLLLDEVVQSVNIQLDPATEHWLLSVRSEGIRGQVRLPYVSGELIEASFERLHIGEAPDMPEDEAGNNVVASEVEILFDELETVEYVMPRVDPLAHIDPRRFPAMRATVASLIVRGIDFGSWQFALEPEDGGAAFNELRVDARGLQIGREDEPARFYWAYDGDSHHSELTGVIRAGNLGEVLSAYGYAPNLESREAVFDARLDWQGSPGYFSAVGLSGDVDLSIRDGRFLRGTGAANNALKLISIINFDAVVRRLRFSDDLVRQGLAYDEIRGSVKLDEGVVTIEDRLQIIGPSSLFQVSGQIDLPNESIDGNLYVTLPVSENIPWLSGLAVLNNLINWQVAIGVFVLDRIFGDQVDNLTSAQYVLQGPWDELEPRLYQVFSGGS